MVHPSRSLKSNVGAFLNHNTPFLRVKSYTNYNHKYIYKVGVVTIQGLMKSKCHGVHGGMPQIIWWDERRRERCRLCSPPGKGCRRVRGVRCGMCGGVGLGRVWLARGFGRIFAVLIAQQLRGRHRPCSAIKLVDEIYQRFIINYNLLRETRRDS